MVNAGAGPPGRSLLERRERSNETAMAVRRRKTNSASFAYPRVSFVYV